MGALDDVQAKIEQGNQALMAKAHEVSPNTSIGACAARYKFLFNGKLHFIFKIYKQKLTVSFRCHFTDQVTARA